MDGFYGVRDKPAQKYPILTNASQNPGARKDQSPDIDKHSLIEICIYISIALGKVLGFVVRWRNTTQLKVGEKWLSSLQ